MRSSQRQLGARLGRRASGRDESNAGAELLETATRDGDKWSRGSVQTRARAAFRLKAFETRPDASSTGPSDGSKASATLKVAQLAPVPADHGSLVQERMAAKQQTRSSCCAFR